MSKIVRSHHGFTRCAYCKAPLFKASAFRAGCQYTCNEEHAAALQYAMAW